MREYIVGIVVLVFLVGVCRLIGYRADDDAASRFAFAVLILYAVVTPATDLLPKADELDMSDFEIDISDYSEEYKKAAEDAFVSGIKSMICDNFSLPQENVRVLVSGFVFESMSAERITVFLSGSAVTADNKKIEKYVRESGAWECDVRIELG